MTTLFRFHTYNEALSFFYGGDARPIQREILESGKYKINSEWEAAPWEIAVKTTSSIAEFRMKMSTPKRKFACGEYVTKTKGSSWTGRIVGTYSTALTPLGYCVESVNEPGSVQIYPEAALELVTVCFKCGRASVVKRTETSAVCRNCLTEVILPAQPEQLCLNPKT